MVIRMTDSSKTDNNSSANSTSSPGLRRATSKRYQQHPKNTRAEFKRLKTILPSIKRKNKVSKLDIILEAIKYIDDLQDQLIDRLTGTHSQREATLLALTEQDMQKSRARLTQLRKNSEDAEDGRDLQFNMEEGDEEEEQQIEEEEEEDSGIVKDASSGDEASHASLEL